MIIIEDKESRGGQDSFDGSASKLVYKVQIDFTTEVEGDVYRFFYSSEDYAPRKLDPVAQNASLAFLYRSAIVLTPIEAGIFRVEVNYTQLKPTTWSMTTGGGTSKTTYSRGTERAYDKNGLQAVISPNFQQGINVTKNAVEGVDITVSQPMLKITKQYEAADIDTDYIELLEDYTGKCNEAFYEITVDDVVFSFQFLELKLDNADVQPTPENHREITYTFAISRGIYTHLPDTWRYIGNPGDANTIVVKDKPGWDYLWVHDEEEHDAAGYFLRRPKTVYVENVIPARDFSELKL